jgi:hypothetical protein
MQRTWPCSQAGLQSCAGEVPRLPSEIECHAKHTRPLSDGQRRPLRTLQLLLIQVIIAIVFVAVVLHSSAPFGRLGRLALLGCHPIVVAVILPSFPTTHGVT